MITVQMPPLRAGEPSCRHFFTEDHLAVLTCVHCGKELYAENWSE